MAKFNSPVLGYNNNVRHRNRVFHIQTEDSGVNHPHIITHLFMDGGRILKSMKRSYAEHVGSDGLTETVRQLMKEQHKAMFIALRDGEYDEDGAQPTQQVKAPPVDVDALEAAAARLAAQAAAPAPVPSPTPTPIPAAKPAGRYQTTRPAAASPIRAPSTPPGSIFGSDLLSEKSLDEVILSYLAEDLDDDG